jgi:hypothetical protein
MRTLLSSLGVAALIFHEALAKRTWTSEICQTKFGTSSIAFIPTSSEYQTKTYTITSIKYQRHHSTVTPPALTVTNNILSVAHTTVLETPPTDTVDIDVTKLIISTTFAETETQTTTTISTKVEESTSTTYSYLAGYIPIQTSLPGSQFLDADGNPQQSVPGAPDSGSVGKREVPANSRGAALFRLPVSPINGKNRKVVYPTAILCHVTTHVPTTTVIRRRRTAIIVTAPTPIETTNSTSIITVTDTSYSRAVTTHTISTITITQTNTVIPQVTKTVTNTVTNTAIIPGPTVHDRCQILETFANAAADGTYYHQGYLDDRYLKRVYATADSLFDCCERCASDPTCEAGLFYDGNNCGTFSRTGNRCSSEGCNGALAHGAGSASSNVVWFNGDIGQINREQ